eukprot:3259803-Alexandrium_andersonii.AAC.1
MTGKGIEVLVGSFTAGQASSPAAMSPTQEQALEGLLADRSSPAKGDEQQGEAEPAGPSRPGEDAGAGNATRNKKR